MYILIAKSGHPGSYARKMLLPSGPGVEVIIREVSVLGHHSILSQDAYLCGATHDYNTVEFTYLKKQITIEPYVWICAKAIVLPGVHCKEGSVLGAGSVTSKDLEPWTLYTGKSCPGPLKDEKISF